MRLEGKHVSEREQETMIRGEMELMRGCDALAAVCERERQHLVAHGYDRVHVLGHALAPEPTPKGFDGRRDLLFVGSVHEPKSPNVDSLEWFIRKCLPRVAERLGRGVRLVVAGHGTSEFLGDYDCDQIKVLGAVDDLTALYDDARVFVAPTRFAAGIPHKAHEAAARGIPIVTTTLIASQLGWRDGEELLAADDPTAFAAACARLYTDRPLWERLRANALARVGSECCPAKFVERLREIIE